jgi:uncharacterized protein
MKIAIISDTHDNLATLAKFINYVKENPVESVIHCGDIASGETIEYLAKNFNGKILAVFGNMDYRESVQTVVKKHPEKITLWQDFGQAEFKNLKIGFCHHKETALPRTKNNEFDFIFYGHTHKPWLETINNCQFANPGTLSGMIYKAAFAILDLETKKLELIIIDRIKKRG